MSSGYVAARPTLKLVACSVLAKVTAPPDAIVMRVVLFVPRYSAEAFVVPIIIADGAETILKASLFDTPNVVPP
jgi:hypothetical protein